MICFIKEWCMHLPFFVIKRQGEKDRLEHDTGIEKWMSKYKSRTVFEFLVLFF